MKNPSALSKSMRIPFDSLTLRAVVAELRSRLIGGQIQEIRQPAPMELRLGIRSQGRNYLLVLSDDTRFARVHLTTQKSPNAPTPPTFCMALRKHAEGSVIRDIRQRGFDRIFEMEIDTHLEEGERATVTLIAELMGKHSNLILVGANGTILEAAKRIPRRINRFREVLPGIPYQLPPEQEDRVDPFAPDAPAPLLQEMIANPERDQAALIERLMNLYSGMSPFLAQEIATRILPLPGEAALLPSKPSAEPPSDRPISTLMHPPANGEEAASLAERLQSVWDSIFGRAQQNLYQPVSVLGTDGIAGAYPFPLLQIPEDVQKPAEELNAALDLAFSHRIERADVGLQLGEVRGQIERDIKRFTRQRDTANRSLEEADRAEQQQQAGELLLANLWKVQAGDREVTVQDYFDPDYADRTIPLDPKLSPQENAEACFRRYRKQRDGQATALTRQKESQDALEKLNRARQQLLTWETEATGTEEAVRQLRQLLKQDGFLRAAGNETEEETKGGKSGPDFQGHKIRRYTTPEGYEIYLGETATANDFLTTRLATPNDIWLHVRASTSAHVIIRTQGHPEAIPRAVLERAALLCAQHSNQKHSALVPVDYTLKKYVRKPRGAAPGSADYHHETTLHITP